MTKEQSCALCGGPDAKALYDGRRIDKWVMLCTRCLAMLRAHPEERALLSIVHFGHPVGVGARPHRPAGE